jgi:signal transduction histidine kinase
LSADIPGIETRPTRWNEGGGETGALIRSLDWSATPLGPTDGWPNSLKVAIGILLHSRHPMFLWWGPELIQFYNDAYTPSFGQGKHPAAMGQAGRDCWQEIWPIIGPQIDDVMTHGKPSWNEDHLVPIFRNDRLEECYWTYGYSPVIGDDGNVDGTLVVCTETTARVIAQRRLESARALLEATAAATDRSALVRSAADVLAGATSDIPFALLFTIAGPTRTQQLAEAVGMSHDDFAARFGDAFVAQLPALAGRDDTTGVVHPLPAGLPGGTWPEHPTAAFVAPLCKTPGDVPNGYVVFGLSPRLPFDDRYRDFLTQLAAHICTAQVRIDAQRVRAALLSELESANRAKDEFLAMLGHELRNPLSPIVTALELMKLHRDGGESERTVIERQVEHLIRLVDDLLDVSKITRGKIELKREVVELAEVVANAVHMASVLLEQRNHTLIVDVARSGLAWEGDPVRLAQVLANLLTNAARYTPPGGRIQLSAHRDADQIRVSVSDNGVGIAPDMLPRIFELFVQGRRSLDRAEGGLGLGLTLARSLVTLHGGTISAFSDGLGKGTTFTIRLPAPSAAVVAGKRRAAAHGKPPLAAHGKRVLVVDDNVDAAEMLGELLEESGHEVLLANDPIAALKSIEEQNPDVAVVDIGLPVMDGYQLAERIRQNLPGSHCRLVALSGYGQEHDYARSKQAGFVEHLVKPVDLATLLRVVDA